MKDGAVWWGKDLTLMCILYALIYVCTNIYVSLIDYFRGAHLFVFFVVFFLKKIIYSPFIEMSLTCQNNLKWTKMMFIHCVLTFMENVKVDLLILIFRKNWRKGSENSGKERKEKNRKWRGCEWKFAGRRQLHLSRLCLWKQLKTHR